MLYLKLYMHKIRKYKSTPTIQGIALDVFNAAAIQTSWLLEGLDTGEKARTEL